jgi:hypothetical protein
MVTRQPSDPPGASYLAERDRLGFPAHPGVISRPCPWCGADPFRPCHVRATGKLRREPHEARQAAA